MFSTLQNSAKGFCRVVMNIATRILFMAMVNPVMSGKLFANESIGTVFISDQIRILINKALYLRGKLSDFVAGHWHGPNRTVAFNGHQYSLLVGAFAAFVFNACLITGFATNVFFIQLNHTAECRNDLRTGLHHLAHRMT